MEFSNESSLRTQGAIRRGFSFWHWSSGFFSLEARGYGSLRSQGGPAESFCEATTASRTAHVLGVQSAKPNPERNAGDQRNSCGNRVRRSVQSQSEDKIGMCIRQIHLPRPLS